MTEPPTVHIKSFGCQMNKLDTALVASALEDAGFRLTDDVKEADAVLINTCSVRQHAEDRVFSHLGHLKHLKQHRPHMVVGVIGCMAQRLGSTLLEHEAVNIVCGPAQIPQIAEMLRQAIARNDEKRLAVIERIRQETPRDDGALERFESAYGVTDEQIPHQAFVRVMRGCNRFCTYCVVPYVRGPEACRPPEAILEQVKKLADAGVKQVTLLGQTVNSYKYDAGGRTSCLADLLEMTARVLGIEWVRFVTSYPAGEFYEQILQAMAGSAKTCHYLHMPAQSGSDRVLAAMNRRYTAAHYLELIEWARAVVPDIAVAGDFIVGFPGETEEDFEATVDLAKKARYKNSFIFKYSPRPGTAADRRLADSVRPEVKQWRNVELLAVQEQISMELNQAFVGRRVRVLVEGPSKKAQVNAAPMQGGQGTCSGSENESCRLGIEPAGAGLQSATAGGSTQGDFVQLVGRTSTDYIVVFHGPATLAGCFAEVCIVKATPLTLFGDLAHH